MIWINVWKIVLVVALGLFAVLSIFVIVGGIKELFFSNE